MKIFNIFVCVILLTIGFLFAQTPAVEKVDAKLDELICPSAQLEQLAEGFEWSEGPEWIPEGQFLLFTDIPTNTIYKWKDSEGLSVYLRPSGLAGGKAAGEEVGSNGLMLDPKGDLVMCDHGNHAIARLNAKNYTKTFLVTEYKGKRLNSPNDLVVKSNGDIYFTDPPYGLEGLDNSPVKELDFCGVYLLRKNGELVLLTKEFTRPNGIALSPDEKTLYVAQSDDKNPIIKAFPIQADGMIGNGKLLFDSTPLRVNGRNRAHDGLAVDAQGNLWVTGPGGVIVITPEGKHLGTILTGNPTANCTFGGVDGNVLYITSEKYLFRINTKTRGMEFK